VREGKRKRERKGGREEEREGGREGGKMQEERQSAVYLGGGV